MNENKKTYLGKKSIYYYAIRLDLDAYEFDYVKRLLRSKAGQELKDIEKSKAVLKMMSNDSEVEQGDRTSSRFYFDMLLIEMLSDYKAKADVRVAIDAVIRHNRQGRWYGVAHEALNQLALEMKMGFTNRGIG